MRWTIIASLLLTSSPVAADELQDFLDAVDVPAQAASQKSTKAPATPLGLPSYVLGPDRPMHIRVESMTMPECMDLARDFSNLFAAFGKAKTLSEQKNEAVYSVCFMGKSLRISCRSPGEWVTAENVGKDC